MASAERVEKGKASCLNSMSGLFALQSGDGPLSAVIDLKKMLLPKLVDIADEKATDDLFENVVRCHFQCRLCA